TPDVLQSNGQPIFGHEVFDILNQPGMITPPFGVNLFAACTVAKISLDRVIKDLIPFIGVILACLTLISYVPEISLTLRDWVYNK
uniref:TRAP transporter large permease subunit n=1 Tax=Limnohabitans sp. TaxID=1907725 RepID=UPI0040482346